MVSRLNQIIRQAAGKRVLLVGDLILDRYVYGDAERISPEAPVPVLRVVERGESVGGCGSVAACLAALGVEVTACGVVGSDPAGKRLVELMQASGADCSCVRAVNDRPTTAKTRFVGLAQHRHRQQLMRVDEESTAPLTEADREQLLESARRVVRQSQAVCIEDYEKGVVDAELVAALVEAAKETDIPVLVDPGRITDYSKYRGATALTPNRNELSLATGASHAAHADIAASAERLRSSIDAQAIVVTLDREGALIVEEGGKWQHVPTRPRSVYDNTGAGDAVLAMLATALVGGANWTEAVHLANVAGGLEVEKFGCVPITADEVLADLRLEERQHASKLRSAAELANELKLRRDRGETVAFTNGCFDILHKGHIDYLTRCKKEASVLVVAINSDASVRAQQKGDERPIFSELDRAHMLGALSCVDYVVIFGEPTPQRIVEQLRPDVLIKGEDWAERGVVGREFIESIGGRVVLLPLLQGYSTTSVVDRIRRSQAPAE